AVDHRGRELEMARLFRGPVVEQAHHVGLERARTLRTRHFADEILGRDRDQRRVGLDRLAASAFEAPADEERQEPDEGRSAHGRALVSGGVPGSPAKSGAQPASGASAAASLTTSGGASEAPSPAGASEPV